VFENLPEINGRNCVAVHCVDLQQQKDDAYALLASIANGDLQFITIESEVLKFFKERGCLYIFQTFLTEPFSANNTEGNPSLPCEEPH